MNTIGFSTALISLAALFAPAPAPAATPGSGAGSCEDLTTLRIPDVDILDAQPVAAGGFIPDGASEPLQAPAFCRLSARAPAAVNFEVWLPEDWNGKFQGVGNGGMAGSISHAALARGVNRGYAAVSTDTGHTTSDVPFDASWARGRPDLIEDFGHRALHLATVHGKTITEAFYGVPPSHAYYLGCSKGGQQGLMEAQRYPDDYDGILVGNPANDWTRFYAGAHLWYSLATLSDPAAYLTAAKTVTLGNAVNQACDALDGIEDGVLLDPRACDFDPASLTCPVGVDDDSCLTAPQVEAVQKIWSGVSTSSGELVYPGLVPGGEAAPGGWSRWVTGREPFTSLHWLGGEGFFRWFVFEDPDWDFTSFDYDEDLALALDKVGAAVDARDPDLRPFQKAGGKLLLYHGWSDPDISPLASIEYYERVVETLAEGKEKAQAELATRSFFRLFMVPGLGHCRGGPGPDRFDGLTALENWVERDMAPETIVASKLENGEVTRTLPLCPYPETPVWDGQSDPYSAASFACRVP